MTVALFTLAILAGLYLTADETDVTARSAESGKTSAPAVEQTFRPEPDVKCFVFGGEDDERDIECVASAAGN